MYITCLDVEGVLVPEIWIAFAEASGIPELKKTTRDEPDYDKLMRWRPLIMKKLKTCLAFFICCILSLNMGICNVKADNNVVLSNKAYLLKTGMPQ